MRPWTIPFKIHNSDLWNNCFYTVFQWKLITQWQSMIRERVTVRGQDHVFHAALKGWLKPRTTFRTCQGEDKLPLLRQSSINILYSSWELASIHEWFPVMLWHSSVAKRWRMEMPVLSWDLSIFISCWHFLLFLGSSLLQGSGMWIEVVLCWRGQLKTICDFQVLVMLGTTGNLWTANNSFYVGYCVTTEWLLLKFVAPGDWIQIHHVCRVCS